MAKSAQKQTVVAVKKADTKPKKKIILLSDGTGNSRAKVWKSNVWRFYKALNLSREFNQVAFYDDGVGTSNTKVIAALGGIFGFGLARNVRELYSFLCRNYEEGAEIYIFGFSRGAFTARVLAAFICSQGIVKNGSDEAQLSKSVRTAYKTFRRESFGGALLNRPMQWFYDGWNWLTGNANPDYRVENNIKSPGTKPPDPHPDDGLIHFMGLWDTVDAYGGPIDELTSAFDRLIWPLTASDRNISNRISRVCHALALDEQRQSFEPTLINEEGQAEVDQIDKERITQVWFSGVHSDIGGGYPDNGLALVTLQWMMDRCRDGKKLEFIESERKAFASGADHTAKLNDSRAGPGVMYRYEPRSLEKLCCDTRFGFFGGLKWLWSKVKGSGAPSVNHVCIETPKIHHTVFERIKHYGGTKAPFNVPGHYAMVGEDGSLYKPAKKASSKMPLEAAERAGEREANQNVLWNKVWAGRVIYYATLIAIVALLAFPMAKTTPLVTKVASEQLSYELGTLLKLVEKIPETVQQLVSFLPGSDYLKPIFEYYSDNHWLFIFLVLSIGALLKLGGSVQESLYNQMGMVWADTWRSSGAAKFKPGKLSRRMSDTYFSKIYQALKKVMKGGAEIPALGLFICLILAVFSRIAMLGLDGIGAVCTPHDGDDRKLGMSMNFQAENPCFATGIKAEKGEVYQITLQANVLSDKEHQRRLKLSSSDKDKEHENRSLASESNESGNTGPDESSDKKIWRDEGIISDLNGWRETRWWQHLLIPFRRHLMVDWYQPIVRIGSTNFNRVSMIKEDESDECTAELCKPKEDSPYQCSGSAAVCTHTIEFKLTALSEGELFIYLNDGVFINPKWISYFYDNNNSEAKVTITKIAGEQNQARAE